jgi:hypothetical protein
LRSFPQEFAEASADSLRPPSIFLPILRETLGICIALSNKRGYQIDSPKAAAGCIS